ncbi:winged helix-turn-helix transcriptional regulator [Variovorax sp. RT4R15]|uniref:winged helix-turn-helix transcriptional regulator n=1 Tax=Variovorax sp. RT4R15 TaxID=3443737 RepID=UPI003F48D9F4
MTAIVHATACPVEQWLGFLGHRWNAVILWHLGDGPLHHSELMLRLPGIRPKALAKRLVALVGQGLVSRSRIAGFPTRVSYALTGAGSDLLLILDQLATWAEGKRTDNVNSGLGSLLTEHLRAG